MSSSTNSFASQIHSLYSKKGMAGASVIVLLRCRGALIGSKSDAEIWMKYVIRNWKWFYAVVQKARKT